MPKDEEGCDAPPVITTIQGLPDAEWVEEMAAALMANPVNTITNRGTVMHSFRGQALATLAATPDPYARGLLLGYERHRHALVVHSDAMGR